MRNDVSDQINSLMDFVGVLKTNPTMGNYLHSYWVAFVTTLSVALCLTLVSRGFGQTVQANQADLARNRAELATAPNTYPGAVVEGHAVPSPNDPDLGEQEILKRAEGYQPFTASVAAQTK